MASRMRGSASATPAPQKKDLNLGDVGELNDRLVDKLKPMLEAGTVRRLSLGTSYTAYCYCSTLGDAVARNKGLEEFVVTGDADEETNWKIAKIVGCNPTLQVLRIQDQKVYALPGNIARCLSYNKTLREFDLNGHRLGGHHLEQIALGLAGNRHLSSVDLESDMCEDAEPECIEAFAKAMETNFTLLELKLPDLGADDAMVAIRKALRRNRRFASRLNQVLLSQRAHRAHHDAKRIFRAAADGRPMELAKRLRLGKLAGGLEVLVDGKTALEAAEAGGHAECVSALRACMG